MNMKKLLGLSFALVLLSGILTACGGSNNNELVGVWEFNEPAVVTELTFNADGTGIEFVSVEDPEVEVEFTFEWSVEGDIITIDFDGDDEYLEEQPIWIFPFSNGEINRG